MREGRWTAAGASDEGGEMVSCKVWHSQRILFGVGRRQLHPSQCPFLLLAGHRPPAVMHGQVRLRNRGARQAAGWREEGTGKSQTEVRSRRQGRVPDGTAAPPAIPPLNGFRPRCLPAGLPHGRRPRPRAAGSRLADVLYRAPASLGRPRRHHPRAHSPRDRGRDCHQPAQLQGRLALWRSARFSGRHSPRRLNSGPRRHVAPPHPASRVGPVLRLLCGPAHGGRRACRGRAARLRRPLPLRSAGLAVALAVARCAAPRGARGGGGR